MSKHPTALRVASLCCGLVYLPLGLVWAYGFAFVMAPLGMIGLWLERRAAVRDPSNGKLARAARWTNYAAFACSAVALVVTLAFN